MNRKMPLQTVFFILSLLFLVFFFFLILPDQIGGKMTESRPNLPKIVGFWTKPDLPQIVTEKNIFDYMDGAGELYLSYRFRHLESYEYIAQKQQSILVELYFMKTSDDAFGLLSLDWGGEAVKWGSAQIKEVSSSPWPRAFYGEGLLRLWSDNIYARIMAYQETPESKEAVLKLGQSIVTNRRNPPAPEILQKLPDSFLPNWELRRDRASYFRSHLVLNSLYYLGQENMLDLDLTAEAITASYEKRDSPPGKPRIQFLFIKYPNAQRARNALSHFHRVYLSEIPSPVKPDASSKIVNILAVEEGWLGYRLQGNSIAFIFECPDQETALEIIDQI